jgi:hypothetical protein
MTMKSGIGCFLLPVLALSSISLTGCDALSQLERFTILPSPFTIMELEFFACDTPGDYAVRYRIRNDTGRRFRKLTVSGVIYRASDAAEEPRLLASFVAEVRPRLDPGERVTLESSLEGIGTSAPDAAVTLSHFAVRTVSFHSGPTWRDPLGLTACREPVDARPYPEPESEENAS